MSIQTLLLVALQVSIFLAVLTIGMETAPADLRHVLARPAQLTRSLFALNVLGPLVAILVCKTFSLHPALIVALVTLSIAPVSNLFSSSITPLVARAAYANGLFFASTVLSVVLTPLAVKVILWIFGGQVDVDPMAVVKVVFASVLLPLGAGLAVSRWVPAARRWVPAIRKASMLVLLACALVIVAGAWSLMGSLVREGTLLAIAIIALLGLLAGHLLGGPEEDDRTVLAHAVVSRHPGVAIAVAGFADQQLAPIGVLLAVLVSSIAVMPYTRWRKRRRLTGTGKGSAPFA